MRHDRSRILAMTMLLSGILGAQSLAPKPGVSDPIAKLPAKASKAKAKRKPVPDSYAPVKPEVTAKSMARSKELRAEKAKVLPSGPQVGINSGSKEELKRLPGMTEAYANAIIAKRPYKTRTELVTRDVIPAALYQTLRRQLVTK